MWCTPGEAVRQVEGRGSVWHEDGINMAYDWINPNKYRTRCKLEVVASETELKCGGKQTKCLVHSLGISILNFDVDKQITKVK